MGLNYILKHLLMMKEGDAMRITPKQKEVVDCIKFDFHNSMQEIILTLLIDEVYGAEGS